MKKMMTMILTAFMFVGFTSIASAARQLGVVNSTSFTATILA